VEWSDDGIVSITDGINNLHFLLVTDIRRVDRMREVILTSIVIKKHVDLLRKNVVLVLHKKVTLFDDVANFCQALPLLDRALCVDDFLQACLEIHLLG
jgi:hypothetical protein